MTIIRRLCFFAAGLVLFLWVALFVIRDKADAATPGRLGNEVLASLIPGSADIPWTAILWDSNIGASRRYRTLPDASVAEYIWCGPPLRSPGKMTVASSSIYIRVLLAPTPEAAAVAVQLELKEYAVGIPEVTASKSWSFADRVWYSPDSSGGRIVFTRGNAIVDIFMYSRESVDAAQLIELAQRVAHRIDDALAGKPVSPAVLPPSATEMGLELEDAWDSNNAGKLLGAKAITIALKNGKSQARTIPACRIGKNAYMVPLGHVAGVMGSRKRVLLTKGRATAIIAGKSVTVTNGKLEVTIDGRKYRLSAKPEFKGKQVFVPLSVIEKVLGHNIKWVKTGSFVTAAV